VNSKSLIISAPARRDLAQIGDYTQRTWGAALKRKYLNILKTAFKALRNSPAMGVARDDIAPGLHVLTVEKHMIYHRVNDEGALVIVRVLHHAMEPTHHLPQTKT